MGIRYSLTKYDIDTTSNSVDTEIINIKERDLEIIIICMKKYLGGYIAPLNQVEVNELVAKLIDFK